jgi:hypothetical protein
MTVIFLDFKEFCFEEVNSGYSWAKTPVGTLVVKNCPAGKVGV